MHPHLVWIYSDRLSDKLDSATWVETTRELRKLGWRVTLIAAGPAGRHTLQGVEVHGIAMPGIFFARQAAFHLKVLSLLLREWTATDFILFHEMSAAWLLPLHFLRRLSRRQTPLLVMDIRTLSMPPACKRRLKDRLREGVLALTSRAARHWVDGYTVITWRMGEALHLPPAKVWGAWPSGVNLEGFAAAQAGRCWPRDGERLQIMYTGSLDYERNLPALIEAVKRANAEGINFRLTLLGDGTARTELEAAAAGCAGSVQVVPPIPHAKVPVALAGAHAGVLPFPDEEKFRVSSPIKLFEYMAAGLPIVATRIACHTDVLGDPDFAFWAERADADALLAALRRLWLCRDRLSVLGAEAAEAARAWTWEEAARKLKTALEPRLTGGSVPLAEDRRKVAA
jgi:glycosyltransferase involved in cell wall biosynthesis